MAFLSSERFCVKSQRRRNTLCQSRLEREWKTRLEGRGGAGTRAFVLFTLEMKLSPANLAFRKKALHFFPPSLCFSLSFWKRSIQVLIRTLLWKISQLFGVILFGRECYRVMSNLSDDLWTIARGWQTNNVKEEGVGSYKNTQDLKRASLPVCFSLSLDGSTGMDTVV